MVLENAHSPQKGSSMREELGISKAKFLNVKYEPILEFPKEWGGREGGGGGGLKSKPLVGRVWGTAQSVVRYQSSATVFLIALY